MIRRLSTISAACGLMIFVVLGACGGPSEPPSIDASVSTIDGPSRDWPQWRGPDRDGHAEPVAGLAEGFGDRQPVEVWRQPIGDGFAGISVVDGTLYTLAADGDSEHLLALDAATGEPLWRHDLGGTLIEGHGNGPRSAPAIDDAVYAMGSLGRFVAVSTEGEELWRFDFSRPPTWGYASSPLVLGDLVIVHGTLSSTVVDGRRIAPTEVVHAFDRASGEIRWSAGDGGVGYGSPLSVEIDGETQVVSFLGNGLFGFEPETGDVLWRYDWTTSYGVNAAEPVFIPPDRFYLSSGYGVGAAAVRLVENGDGWQLEEVWRGRQMKNHFSSSVLVDDVIYGFDNSIMKALRADDGTELWKARGFGKGSMVALGEHVLVLGERGDLGLMEASAESFREVGRVQVLEGRSWTPPSVAGRWLYVRNHEEIVGLMLGE